MGSHFLHGTYQHSPQRFRSVCKKQRKILKMGIDFR
jgi:hypothetical protein